MSEPGVLPSVQTSALERFGVTSVTPILTDDGCRLRAIWSQRGSGRGNLLPVSPKAKTGTVIHRFYDLIASEPGTEIEDLIGRATQETEESMAADCLESHMVPLSRSNQQHSVKIEDAKILGIQIRQEAQRDSPPSAQPGDTGRMFGREIWVESECGRLGGLVDSVSLEDGELIIRDDKGGALFVEEDGLAVINRHYESQLMLYSALYEKRFGRIGNRLVLRRLFPRRDVEIERSPDECRQALNAAIEVVKGIQDGLSNNSDLAEFANPSSGNCRFCPFRPNCQRYLDEMEDWEIDNRFDILGEIEVIRELGNGTYFLKLRRNDGTTAKVERVSANPVRNPSMTGAKVGDLIGIFNIYYRNQTHCFANKLFHTCYLLPFQGDSGSSESISPSN